jgi:uncharacterized membrane protein
MPRIGRFFGGDDDQDDANRQTASLAGMAVALLLVVVGLFLIRQLHAKSMVEDCLMSGRINCDKVLAEAR